MAGAYNRVEMGSFNSVSTSRMTSPIWAPEPRFKAFKEDQKDEVDLTSGVIMFQMADAVTKKALKFLDQQGIFEDIHHLTQQ